MSGLLNQAIKAWHVIKKQGRLTEPDSVQRACREFHATTDPLTIWLDQYSVDDPDAIVAKSVLRAAYGAACERSGRPSPTDNAFGRAMRTARPGLANVQRIINGRKQWCYAGISLRDDQSRVSHESQEILPLSNAREKGNATGVVKDELKEGEAVIPVTPVTGDGIPHPHPTDPNREVTRL